MSNIDTKLNRVTVLVVFVLLDVMVMLIIWGPRLREIDDRTSAIEKKIDALDVPRKP